MMPQGGQRCIARTCTAVSKDISYLKLIKDNLYSFNMPHVLRISFSSTFVTTYALITYFAFIRDSVQLVLIFYYVGITFLYLTD